MQVKNTKKKGERETFPKSTAVSCSENGAVPLFSIPLKHVIALLSRITWGMVTDAL